MPVGNLSKIVLRNKMDEEMTINKEFFDKIEPVLKELEKKLGTDFVVFGSGPLYLTGVLELKEDFNDLDIAVRDVSPIVKEAKEVLFRGDLNQKLYKINIQGINVDVGQAWPGQEEVFEKLFENPIVVKGFKFVNLDSCQAWKEDMVKKYGREKDKIHLEKIKEYKLKNNIKK